MSWILSWQEIESRRCYLDFCHDRAFTLRKAIMQFNDAAEIHAALTEAGIDPHFAEQLSQRAGPAVWLRTDLVADDSEITVGTTKIGGCPDLPPGSSWPHRSAYPNAAKLSESHRRSAATADSELKWAKSAEECEQYREEARQRVHSIENPFPLGFLAQINLADIWAAGPVDEDLPRSGLISIFYDCVQQPWGYDPQENVGYAIQFHETQTLTRLSMPQPLLDLPAYYRIHATACEPFACMTPLPAHTAEFQELGLPEEVADAFYDWWMDDAELSSTEGGEDWACHHVGGWPTPVQQDMHVRAALVAAGHYCGNSDAYRNPDLQGIRDTACQWLLLAQIGSDEKSGLAWGDSGQVYVWIRRDDLQARRFERVQVILQCY